MCVVFLDLDRDKKERGEKKTEISRASGVIKTTLGLAWAGCQETDERLVCGKKEREKKIEGSRVVSGSVMLLSVLLSAHRCALISCPLRRKHGHRVR